MQQTRIATNAHARTHTSGFLLHVEVSVYTYANLLPVLPPRHLLDIVSVERAVRAHANTRHRCP